MVGCNERRKPHPIMQAFSNMPVGVLLWMGEILHHLPYRIAQLGDPKWCRSSSIHRSNSAHLVNLVKNQTYGADEAVAAIGSGKIANFPNVEPV